MTTTTLSLVLITLALCGIGRCMYELRKVRRGLGALDEGMRHQMGLANDAQDRRFAALAALALRLATEPEVTPARIGELLRELSAEGTSVVPAPDVVARWSRELARMLEDQGMLKRPVPIAP